MSIVADQIRRVDAEFDRVLSGLSPSQDSLAFDEDEPPRFQVAASPRVNELQHIIKALSTTSSSRPLLPLWRISMLLGHAALAESTAELITQEEDEKRAWEVEFGDRDELSEAEKKAQEEASEHCEELSAYEAELEWLLVGKAAIQIHGLILNTLLESTIPLNDDIWYWDEVLSSYTYTALFAVQTSPIRLWDWAKDICADTRRRFSRLRYGSQEQDDDENLLTTTTRLNMSLKEQWKQFYTLLLESIRDRSLIDIQKRVLSPVALCRSDARKRQMHLKRLREVSASGLGILMDEGLGFSISGGHGVDIREWRGVVERSVALMDTVLENVTCLDTLETGVSDFEDKVFAIVAEDPELSPGKEYLPTRPVKLSRRLQHILQGKSFQVTLSQLC